MGLTLTSANKLGQLQHHTLNFNDNFIRTRKSCPDHSPSLAPSLLPNMQVPYSAPHQAHPARLPLPMVGHRARGGGGCIDDGINTTGPAHAGGGRPRAGDGAGAGTDDALGGHGWAEGVTKTFPEKAQDGDDE